jgi:hypothetical protein
MQNGGKIDSTKFLELLQTVTVIAVKFLEFAMQTAVTYIYFGLSPRNVEAN